MPFTHNLVYNPNTFMRGWGSRGLDLDKLVPSTVWFDIVYKKQRAIVDDRIILPFLLTRELIKLKL